MNSGEWLVNIGKSKLKDPENIDWLKDNVIGPPKSFGKTRVFTLKQMGMVGVYEKEEQHAEVVD